MFDYIWIDALCIMQDSRADWHLESTKMGDIYANSYCNIAATSADPDKGCFTSRSTSVVEPLFISNPTSNDPALTHVIGYDDFWSNSLLDTILHTRGWVLQERLMPPRTVHFTYDQILWECHQTRRAQYFHHRLPCDDEDWAGNKGKRVKWVGGGGGGKSW